MNNVKESLYWFSTLSWRRKKKSIFSFSCRRKKHFPFGRSSSFEQCFIRRRKEESEWIKEIKVNGHWTLTKENKRKQTQKIKSIIPLRFYKIWINTSSHLKIREKSFSSFTFFLCHWTRKLNKWRKDDLSEMTNEERFILCFISCSQMPERKKKAFTW